MAWFICSVLQAATGSIVVIENVRPREAVSENLQIVDDEDGTHITFVAINATDGSIINRESPAAQQ